MEDISINVLVDAKTEYTKQLTNILSPLVFEGFQSLFEEAIQFKKDTQDPRYEDYSELQIFQDFLKKIPKWNQDIIDTETNRIITKSHCEWLEDLLAAVFISNFKILSTVRLKNPTQQMKLTVPKLRNFIHKCYVECSRQIYQNVYLFDTEDITNYERQKNVREIFNIVKEGIVEAVRRLLPVKEIIKTYLGKIYDDEDTDNTIIETGFPEQMFKDFAQNTLKKSIEQFEQPTKIQTPTIKNFLNATKNDINVDPSTKQESTKQESTKQESTKQESTKQESTKQESTKQESTETTEEITEQTQALNLPYPPEEDTEISIHPEPIQETIQEPMNFQKRVEEIERQIERSLSSDETLTETTRVLPLEDHIVENIEKIPDLIIRTPEMNNNDDRSEVGEQVKLISQDTEERRLRRKHKKILRHKHKMMIEQQKTDKGFFGVGVDYNEEV